MDLCFLDAPGQTALVWVVQERSTKIMLLAALPAKTSNSHITRRVVALRKEAGVAHGDVAAKAERHLAIVAIMEGAGRVRVVEQSPVGSTDSNGIAIRTIQSLQRQARVTKGALEVR